MTFNPNQDLRKRYDRMFRKDPLMANTLLVLNEIIEEEGEILFPAIETRMFDEFAKLMLVRCPDPRKYAL